jgi:hypothetical protein
MFTRNWRPGFRVAGKALLGFVALVLLMLVAPAVHAAPGDDLDTGLLSPTLGAPSNLIPNPGAAFAAPAAAPVAAAPAAPAAAAPAAAPDDDDETGIGGDSCLQLDAGLTDIGADCDSVGGDAVAVAVAVVSFADDPLGWLVDKMAQGASGIMSWIADTANNATSADITADWWISAYKQAFAIAIVLFGILTLWNMVELGRGKIGPAEFGETITLRSWGFFAGVVFGPPLTKFLIEGAGMLARGIIAVMPGYDAGNLDVTNINESIQGASEGKVIGGVFIAFLLLLLVTVAAIFLFVSLAVQTVVIYLAGAVFPIAFTWIINVKHRGGSMKIPYLILGVIFSRPLLFFLVGIGMAIGRSAVVQGSDDAARNLANVIIAGVVLCLAAFAPLMLLKFAPVIPTGTAGGTGHAAAVSNPGVAQPGPVTRLQRMSRRGGSSGSGATSKGGGGNGAAAGGGGGGGRNAATTPVNAAAAAAGASPSGVATASSRRGIGKSKGQPSGGQPSAAGAAVIGATSGNQPRLLDGPPTPAPTSKQRAGNAARAVGAGVRGAPAAALSGAKALPGSAVKAAKAGGRTAKKAAPAVGAATSGTAAAARRIGHGIAGGVDGGKEW